MNVELGAEGARDSTNVVDRATLLGSNRCKRDWRLSGPTRLPQPIDEHGDESVLGTDRGRDIAGRALRQVELCVVAGAQQQRYDDAARVGYRLDAHAMVEIPDPDLEVGTRDPDQPGELVDHVGEPGIRAAMCAKHERPRHPVRISADHGRLRF
jgi:hypothetical protein